MKELIFALLTGIVMGGAFSLLKLPIPAPQTLAGIMGIVGIFLGYLLVQAFMR